MTEFWNAVRSAIKAFPTSDGRLDLFMSNGLQGQFIARVALMSGLKLRAHLLSYDGRNGHDLTSGLDFCQRHGIPFSVHQFPLEHFFREEIVEWAKTLKLTDFDILILSRAQKVLNLSNAISGSGFPMLSWDSKKYGTWILDGKRIPAEMRPCFFLQTNSEVRDAFFKHRCVRSWMDLAPGVGFEDSMEWRETIIRADVPDFQASIPVKFHEALPSLELVKEARAQLIASGLTSAYEYSELTL